MNIFVVIVIIVLVLGFIIANILLLKQTAKFPMQKTNTTNKDLINKENVKTNDTLEHSLKDD
ncbi:DUF2897 family protein [uncultured Psychrosphaera sp.]|jgi:cell division septal protein FtsQ|uniref:DUF2897 family protein n=1 Tax=uncultured Psychrosphaera sp. TaxID=1403522 RepID=UPI0026055D46|nr:DUF2897 family protein [uncultured Psychrosphaera sp.]